MHTTHLVLILVALQTTACSSGNAPPPVAPTPASPATAIAAAPVAQPANGLSPALTEAITRFRALLADPTDAGIQADFSPTFLAAVPAEKVKSVLTGAKEHLGACTDQQTLKVKDELTAAIRLKCEHGADDVLISINPAPPHLIEGLLMKPADP